MLTACEPVDRDTLQHFIITFTDQLNNCRLLLESHIMLLPVVQKVVNKNSNVATAISHSPGSLHYCQSSQSGQSPHFDTNNYYNQINQNQNQFQNQNHHHNYINQYRDASLSSKGSPGEALSITRVFSEHTEPL